MADQQISPSLNKEEYLRNIRAHRNLETLDFPHKMINFYVLCEILHFQRRSPGCRSTVGQLLDVGCGTGHLLKKVLALGWDAQGVDPFPRGEATRFPLCNRIIKGTVADIHTDCFNIITAVELIEHVENYMALLKGISNLLHPAGEVIVTVPYNWKFRVRMTDTCKLEPMYGHLWKFDTAGLLNDLKLFFDEVKVEPIYSRTMDRRLLRITRLLPLKLGQMLSGVLVKNHQDGGWLMAVAKKKKKQRSVNLTAVSKASAAYYKDSPKFSCT